MTASTPSPASRTPAATATRAAAPAGASAITGRGLVVGYGDRPILDGVDVDIPAGEFTAIVGPNACGKSTLLRALARLLPLSAGEVTVGEDRLGDLAAKELARRVGLLPQHPVTPEGIVVEDLVARGRYPHQGLLRQWSAEDARAVEWALARAHVADLRDRQVSELSGGQRQRVWLAMVLAQDTPVVLLDEPTTFLDITHQVEVLNLAEGLQQEGRTVVAVLHELTLAFRYATHLIVMKEGAIVAQGPVTEVVTPELLAEVYDLECVLIDDPLHGRPIVVPGSTIRR